jgi:hypothetical protein
MNTPELQDWVGDYFRLPEKGFQRHAFLFWKDSHHLAVATLFEEGEVQYHDTSCRGIYIIGRAVLPEHHNSGAGQRIATGILAQFEPDILMTSCTQSASLHSWIGVAQRQFSQDYEVFPRLEQAYPVTFPIRDLGFAVSAFRQLYSSVAGSDLDQVDMAVARLTTMLVRKGMYEQRYDFSSWGKAGRGDPLADALGVGSGDGILLVILRKGLIGS